MQELSSNGDDLADLHDQLRFVRPRKILVDRSDYEVRRRGIQRLAKEPEKTRWRDEDQSFEFVLHSSLLQPLREVACEPGDGVLVRAFAPAHCRPTRVAAVFAKRSAGAIGIDLTVTSAAERMFDLLE